MISFFWFFCCCNFWFTDTGRCPPPYHYYRYLDFCYYIGVAQRLHFQEIKQICNETGGRLAHIESEQKGNYFGQILGM